MKNLDAVILAAGKGQRMKSKLPKVLHKLAGVTLLDHVIRAAKSVNPTTVIIVTGYAEEKVRAAVQTEGLTFVHQSQQLGTGHAVKQAIDQLQSSKTLILFGDVPLISEGTLEQLTAKSEAIALLTQTLSDPTGYGRIVRDGQEHITKIVEEKDASIEEKKINEINTGIMCIDNNVLKNFLSQMENKNASAEFYLTDIVEFANKNNLSVDAVNSEDDVECSGINSKSQLADLERRLQRQKAQELMANGTSVLDPNRLDIRGNLTCGLDVVIDVGCIFEGDVQLEDNVTIEAYSVIKDSYVGEGTTIKTHSCIEGANIGKRNQIGPYARLRPGAKSSDNVRLGNFVEVKASEIGQGSKVNHLSYIGDAKIGTGVNVGAGTITCNYDGANKHQTVLEDDVFIGSNTELVAPVTIGEGSTIAAGSTVTKNVPPNNLALSRIKQTCIGDWKRPEKIKSDE